jgi:hypothetical protein
VIVLGWRRKLTYGDLREVRVSERCWVCGCVTEMLERSGCPRDYRCDSFIR